MYWGHSRPSVKRVLNWSLVKDQTLYFIFCSDGSHHRWNPRCSYVRSALVSAPNTPLDGNPHRSSSLLHVVFSGHKKIRRRHQITSLQPSVHLPSRSHNNQSVRCPEDASRRVRPSAGRSHIHLVCFHFHNPLVRSLAGLDCHRLHGLRCLQLPSPLRRPAWWRGWPRHLLLHDARRSPVDGETDCWGGKPDDQRWKSDGILSFKTGGSRESAKLSGRNSIVLFLKFFLFFSRLQGGLQKAKFSFRMSLFATIQKV